MKVIDVCGFYSEKGGGVRTYVRQKLRSASQAGIALQILVPGPDDRIEQYSRDCAIVHMRSAPFPLDPRYHWFNNSAAVLAMLDQAGPDVVEASSPWKSAALVADWHGSAVRSLFMHADPASAYGYRLLGGLFERDWIDRRFESYWRHLRRMNKAFDSVICPNHEFSNRLQQAGLHKAMAIPMGIEPNVFSPAHRNEALRVSLLKLCNMDATATLFVSAGRFAPEKRWPMVIQAISKMALEHPVGLVLIGEGRRKSELLALTRDNPHIQILPHTSDRQQFAEILASSDALVHGCEAETFGLVAAEARAAGLPLILPDRGGVTDLFNPETDAQFESGNAQSLTNALARWIAAKRTVASNLRDGSPADHNRGLDEHFSDLFAHYQSLVSQRQENSHQQVRNSILIPSLSHASQKIQPSFYN